MCRELFLLLVFVCFVRGKSFSLSESLSHAIFPGTKWCGIGNIAANYNDLGSEKGVDSCCRAHDLCPEEIDTGKMKYGLYNKYFISRLHCRCDKQFYYCLKNSTSPIAPLMGSIYFNVLNYPCFAKKCNKNHTLPWGECSKKQFTWTNQWYQVPKF